MARPRKQEVDYFPHYCEHGKVLFILENHFKNDGYAVFYKIQELLAKTEGHCYDCSKLENWEYLLSKMTTTEETVNAILEKLALMGVIDEDLWKEKRLWMQSFVDSVMDAYSRRKVDLPSKPGLMSTETPVSGVNDDIYPQSKVKKKKEKKRREYIKTKIPDDFDISDRVKKWAQDKGINKLHEHLEAFKLACSAKGYMYVDWDSAFMNAIRNDWARLEGGNGNGRTGSSTNFGGAPRVRSSGEYPVDAEVNE